MSCRTQEELNCLLTPMCHRLKPAFQDEMIKILLQWRKMWIHMGNVACCSGDVTCVYRLLSNAERECLLNSSCEHNSASHLDTCLRFTLCVCVHMCVCVCVQMHLNCVWLEMLSDFTQDCRCDFTFIEAYSLVGLCKKVFPWCAHHLREVKDRNSAFWVSRRAVLG